MALALPAPRGHAAERAHLFLRAHGWVDSFMAGGHLPAPCEPLSYHSLIENSK